MSGRLHLTADTFEWLTVLLLNCFSNIAKYENTSLSCIGMGLHIDAYMVPPIEVTYLVLR